MERDQRLIEAEAESTESARKLDAENFAVRMTDECRTPDEWYALMRFGMGTLLENPSLLVELIGRQAVERANRSPTPKHPGDFMAEIFYDLGLTIARR